VRNLTQQTAVDLLSVPQRLLHLHEQLFLFKESGHQGLVGVEVHQKVTQFSKQDFLYLHLTREFDVVQHHLEENLFVK